MRKLLLTILLIAIAGFVVWAAISILRRPSKIITPQIQAPQKEPQPLVTEPPPDATDDLLQDNLDEALQDIEDLEK